MFHLLLISETWLIINYPSPGQFIKSGSLRYQHDYSKFMDFARLPMDNDRLNIFCRGGYGKMRWCRVLNAMGSRLGVRNRLSMRYRNRMLISLPEWHLVIMELSIP